VVVRAQDFGVSDHPVCGPKEGFAENFLMPQPPLLTRRGICFLKLPRTTWFTPSKRGSSYPNGNG